LLATVVGIFSAVPPRSAQLPTDVGTMVIANLGV
jgi:hypothetical protein